MVLTCPHHEAFKILLMDFRASHCSEVYSCMSFGILFCAGEIVNNHDELMSNFFAQPDALAYGKVSLIS